MLLPFQLYNANVKKLVEADATLVVSNQFTMAGMPIPPSYHPLGYCLATKLSLIAIAIIITIIIIIIIIIIIY